MSHFSVGPIPVAEIDQEPVVCHECQARLAAEAFFDGVGAYYCEQCMDALIERTRPWAEEYARENCRITGRIEPYDAELEFRPTPEEYDAGEKMAYTPRAYVTFHRHERTNYEVLIARLDRDSIVHRVLYDAIRHQTHRLLRDAMPKIDEGEFELDEDLLA